MSDAIKYEIETMNKLVKFILARFSGEGRDAVRFAMFNFCHIVDKAAKAAEVRPPEIVRILANDPNGPLADALVKVFRKMSVNADVNKMYEDFCSANLCK